MQLFICWSGDRSRLVAQALADSLPRMVQGIRVFVSTEIAKGTRWLDAVSRALDESEAGLLCLTPENRDSGWVHYEAEALAKTLRPRQEEASVDSMREPPIFTYLLSVEPDELSGPLAQYQTTVANKGDTHEMIRAIAKLQGAGEWEDSFEREWPDLQERIEAARVLPILDVIPDLPRLFERKTFQEPFPECSDQEWVARYQAARDTMRFLKERQSSVARECRRFEADALDELIGELDGYAMDMRSFLLEQVAFDENDRDHMKCEHRRQAIGRLVSVLSDAGRAPVLDDAIRFETLTFPERKNLIHRLTADIERQLQAGEPPVAVPDVSRAANSDWALDRIVAYLVMERRPDIGVRDALPPVEMEFEKVRSTETPSSFMPLHYSLGPLLAAIRSSGFDRHDAPSIRDALGRVQRYVDDYPEPDRVRRVNEELETLRAALDRAAPGEAPD